VSVEDLAGLSPEQQFKLIADRLAEIEDPTPRAATAMDVFGRSGTKLLAMLSGGAAGIEELQEQARGLGLTITSAYKGTLFQLTGKVNNGSFRGLAAGGAAGRAEEWNGLASAGSNIAANRPNAVGGEDHD